MAIKDKCAPETSQQSAENAAPKPVKEPGEKIYKESIQMVVKVKKGDSQEVLRKIEEISKMEIESNIKYHSIEMKPQMDKSKKRKTFSFKRLKLKEKMDFGCQLYFTVANQDFAEFNKAKKQRTMIINDLKKIFEEDEYRITHWIEREEFKNREKPKDSTDADSGLKVQSNDPQCYIKNDTGSVHYNNYLNCCNTGQGTGCFSGVISMLQRLIPCLK